MPTTRYSAPSCSAHRRSRYSVLSARAVRVTPPRCAGCVTPHRRHVTPRQRETRYSGKPYSANSPSRGREVVCAHGLCPEGGRRRTWQHGAVQLSTPSAPLQSGLPLTGARTIVLTRTPCLLARVLTRTAHTLPPDWDLFMSYLQATMPNRYIPTSSPNTFWRTNTIDTDPPGDIFPSLYGRIDCSCLCEPDRPRRRYVCPSPTATRRFCSSSRSSSPVRHAHALWDLFMTRPTIPISIIYTRGFSRARLMPRAQLSGCV